MTAVMDKPETLQESPATVEDFEVAKVNIDHPQVQHFIQAYFKRMGIEPTTHPLGINWLALVKESTIYCVVGIAGRGDKSLEITDLYCKPSHDGVRAGYLVFRILQGARRRWPHPLYRGRRPVEEQSRTAALQESFWLR